MIILEKYKFELFFGLLGSLFFIPFLGGVHLFDWDEINFAECAREMLETNNYLQVQLNYLPFWEKPPLFFWLQALSMKIFGISEFAARFPNAICGIITLILLFRIGDKLYDTTFGILWAGCYFGAFLPHIYFKSGIIDPYFNLFIFLGLYYFILFYFKKHRHNLILPQSPFYYLFWAGIWISLAILTKGPVAYLIFILCLFGFWLAQKLKNYLSIGEFILFSAIASLGVLSWYGIDILQNGWQMTWDSIQYQYRLFSTHDAGHKGFFGYHFVVLLLGCFPISIFAIRGFFRQHQPRLFQRIFKLWMLILFWIVLLLFSIVKSKIIHYSSLCYYPLTFLSALTIFQIIKQEDKFRVSYKIGLLSIGGIISAVVIALPFVGQNLDKIRPFIKDEFTLANLNASVEWTIWTAGSGIYFFILLIAVIILITKNLKELGFITLFLGTGIMMLSILHVFPKVERYSQGAPVDFFESLQDKDCYVLTVGYKSYAHYFYARTQPDTRPQFVDAQKWKWHLLKGKIDKDVYIVTKTTKEKRLEEALDLQKIKTENGFSFFVRRKK